MMRTRRWSHFTAMVLIGDGVMAIVRPRLDTQAWNVGPRPWRTMMRSMGDHPTLTRCVGLAQVVGGILWATLEEKAAVPQPQSLRPVPPAR